MPHLCSINLKLHFYLSAVTTLYQNSQTDFLPNLEDMFGMPRLAKKSGLGFASVKVTSEAPTPPEGPPPPHDFRGSFYLQVKVKHERSL